MLKRVISALKYIVSALKRIISALWGNFESKDQFKKFAFLAVIFGVIIGIYWGMRPLKDSIFSNIVGVNYIPLAKILSLFLITPLVIFYSKLLDKYPRNKIFYVLMPLYGIVALILTFLLNHQTIGLTNNIESPTRIIGWVLYVYVESFGSLVVALFWGLTSDISKPQEAKIGFPLIYLFGQAGNILGPLLLRAKRFGFSSSAPILGIISILMFLVAILLWIFVKVTPKKQMEGYQAAEETQVEKQKEPGFLDGLKLLLKHGYLLGIVSIIIFYEIIVTILDFFFKATAKAAFPIETDFSEYLASYGVWTGIVATSCVLFGINSIQRKLGMTASLILLPTLVALAVISLRISPILSVSFWIMVFSKAVNYALNQPTIKQLYIPTTKNTKYKAQLWIEMFGSRGSKAAGSVINIFRPLLGPALFIMFSTTISLGIVGVWYFIAIYIARIYNKAIKENKVVC